MLTDLKAVDQFLLSRAAEHQINPSLDEVRAVLDALGDPQEMYPSIVVAGTNGKSSTTRLIAAIALAHGIRAGCYTSPHLVKVTERIQVDGLPLTDQRFIESLNEILPIVLMMEERRGKKLTGFELLTVMALSEFADAPMHLAALEIGLGGTWDAVNVVDAPVSVITPVDFDHQAWLGDTLTSIAGNKAGVIKPGSTVVVQQHHAEALEVITLAANEMQANMLLFDRDYFVSSTTAVGGQLINIQTPRENYQDLFLKVHGEHQAINAATALVALEALLGEDEPLNPDAIAEAFETFNMPGRLEIIRRSPTVVLDIAHNPAGAQILANGLVTSMNFKSLICVLGVLEDKNASGIVEELTHLVDHWIVTTAPSPRAISADDLAADVVSAVGSSRVEVIPKFDQAVEAAIAAADLIGAGSGVLITGSATTAGRARALLGRD
jgi:dihydrofolate synthase/folylpolyglutamate synthase